MSIREVKRICRKAGIRLDSEKSQNFLISRNILRKQIRIAHLSSNDTVLDIGAGFGFLTERLARKTKKVYAIEKDKQIARVLKQRLSSLVQKKKIKVTVGDVMEEKLPKISKIVSNPPYHIVSPLLIKIFKEIFPRREFDCAVMILQKTYAERLLSQPGETNWGRLPAALQYFGTGEIIRTVPRNSFYPPPEVGSALIKLVPTHQRSPTVPFTMYEYTTRLIFSYPKKKVRNAVKIVLKNRNRKWRNLVKKVEKKTSKRIRVRDLRKQDIIKIAEIFIEEKVIKNVNIEG